MNFSSTYLIKFKHLIACGLLIFLVPSIYSIEISENEKRDVYNRIEYLIRYELAYIDGWPELSDNERIADLWHFIIYKMGPKEIPELYPYKKEANSTTDRETFIWNINEVLAYLLSHFYVSNASTSFEIYLREGNSGFKFKKHGEESPHQEYIVTNVTPSTPAALRGITVGDTFYLPAKEEDAEKYGVQNVIHNCNPAEGICRNEWDLLFFKRGKFPHHVFLPIDTNDKYFDKSLNFRPSAEDEQKMRELTPQTQSLSITFLGVKSFLDKEEVSEQEQREGNYYDGSAIAGAMELLIKQQEASSIPALLILDLRNNGGGNPAYGSHLLSYFLKASESYSVNLDLTAWNSFKQSKEFEDIAEGYLEAGKPFDKFFTRKLINYIDMYLPDYVSRVKQDNPQFTGKIAILLDENSASMSEEVAGALKVAYPDRCILIGQRSAGALLETPMSPEPDTIVGSFNIHCPTGDIFLMDGYRPEGLGLPVDIEIQSSSDTQACIRAALEWYNNPSSVEVRLLSDIDYTYPSILDRVPKAERWFKEAKKKAPATG